MRLPTVGVPGRSRPPKMPQPASRLTAARASTIRFIGLFPSLRERVRAARRAPPDGPAAALRAAGSALTSKPSEPAIWTARALIGSGTPSWRAMRGEDRAGEIGPVHLQMGDADHLAGGCRARRCRRAASGREPAGSPPAAAAGRIRARSGGPGRPGDRSRRATDRRRSRARWRSRRARCRPAVSALARANRAAAR